MKTHRFSWADLEGLITASEISGKALYKGEGRRPNLLTWYVTLNGASLSKDMAQRMMIIRVKRPVYDKDWEDETRLFIQQYKCEIIADAMKILKSGEGANGEA